jgi:hypothetical protein
MQPPDLADGDRLMARPSTVRNALDRSDELARLLISSGVTAAALATQVGMSAGNLSKYLALQLLSPADKQRVRAGLMGLAVAYESLRRPRASSVPV